MSIRTAEELAGMRRAGALVARTLRVLAGHVRPGITTGELHGYGVGRTMHEPPAVPNAFVAQLRQPLGEGLVLAIEPMLGLGGSELVMREDGWTVATADGSLAAHVEHTVVVAAGGPLVLTA